MSKVGITTSLNAKKVLQHKFHQDFVSVVDGITFGLMDGMCFNSCRIEWKKEEQIKWAEANALFFRQLSNNLTNYANELKK